MSDFLTLTEVGASNLTFGFYDQKIVVEIQCMWCHKKGELLYYSYDSVIVADYKHQQVCKQRR